MKVARGLRISSKQLAAHATRTALALTGIVIGVSAVIVMVAVGNGAQDEVVGKIEAMGTNLVIVSAGQLRPTAGRQAAGGAIVTTLRPEDATAIGRECASVAAVAPVQSQKLTVKFRQASVLTTVLGTTADYPLVRDADVQRGEFFFPEDDIAATRVAVLGPTVATNVFGGEEPIGERIRIGTVPFEVVGVLESKGVDLNGVDQDDQILIPLRTALRRVLNQDYLSAVHLRSQTQETMAATATEVRELLRERHRLNRSGVPDDFTIQTQADLIDTQREITDTFTLLVGSIAAVSLIVGGIGILAVMLIAIRERTREIGLRLAVGASRRDIRTQFVLEATMLGTGGGVVGMVLGLLGAFALGATTAWSIRVSPTSMILAFAFSFTVGTVFGVYPAARASRLDPIEALRSE